MLKNKRNEQKRQGWIQIQSFIFYMTYRSLLCIQQYYYKIKVFLFFTAGQEMWGRENVPPEVDEQPAELSAKVHSCI